MHGCPKSVLASLALTGLAAGALHAQGTPPPLSLDLSVGAGSSVGGGAYTGRSGLAADVMAAARLRRRPTGAALAALAMSAQGALFTTRDCLPGPGERCLRVFPTLYSVAALAGREWAVGGGAAVRLLGGPAYVWDEGGGETVGLQARLDAATPPVARLALVASARVAALPRLHGTTFGLGALGIGLRVR